MGHKVYEKSLATDHERSITAEKEEEQIRKETQKPTVAPSRKSEFVPLLIAKSLAQGNNTTNLSTKSKFTSKYLQEKLDKKGKVPQL